MARPASLFLKTQPNTIDDPTARTVGSFLLAVQAGLAAQWILEPDHTPSGAEMAEALRRLTVAATSAGDS